MLQNCEPKVDNDYEKKDTGHVTATLVEKETLPTWKKYVQDLDEWLYGDEEEHVSSR